MQQLSSQGLYETTTHDPKPKKRKMGSGKAAMSCNWHILWASLLLLSILLYGPPILWSTKMRIFDQCTTPHDPSRVRIPFRGDLRRLESSWNTLSFRQDSNPRPRLKIALFVKKWPSISSAGGLERHAFTLHRYLARRGHIIHVFTSRSRDRTPPEDLDLKSMSFHFSNSTPAGNLNHKEAWHQFLKVNQTLKDPPSSEAMVQGFQSTKGIGFQSSEGMGEGLGFGASEGMGGGLGFDIIHSESVALPHGMAAGLQNVVVSWHGIGYETIHSDIVQDLVREPGEIRPLDLQRALTERLPRVIEEVKFFPSYAHHIATSDSVGEILRTVYMIPPERVHVIVNGVDGAFFRPDEAAGKSFRAKYGVPDRAGLVIGMAGRLVKDKGHPLVFRALETLIRNSRVLGSFYVLIAGDGPWASRYKELGPSVKVLGSLGASSLGEFYNAVDVFLNPTLRAQGLDHTTIEAMLCGKPVMASRFASIVKSLVVSEDFGYTFSPRFESLVEALERVLADGREVLEGKGRNCRRRAEGLFRAEKMGAAYERLFLCVAKGIRSGVDFCQYPLAGDD